MEDGKPVRRRRLLVALGAGAVMGPVISFAQVPAVRRVGVLATRSRSTPANPDVQYDAFVLGMRELGYVEGKNLLIDWRFADGGLDRLPGLAAELVRLKPEVILTHGAPGTLAAQRAAGAIPIVFAAAGDPVKSGFAASLARPAGNLTGLSLITADLAPKHIELMRSVLPKVKRVAHLSNPANPATQARAFADMKARRAADLVDKIARGAEPGNLPVQLPTVFDFVVNVKSAQALGIKFPPALLFRADKLIQ